MKTSNGWRVLAVGFLGSLAISLALSGCTRSQQVLTREPAPQPPALEGRWDLKEYGPSGAPVPALPDTAVFVVFSRTARSADPAGATGISEDGASWRERRTFCASGAPGRRKWPAPSGDDPGTRFLEELSRVSGYSTDGKELRLFYDGGKGVLRFTRGAP
jgi:hypothetical protein